MLRELTKKDWLSLLGIPENRIPQALVLRGTRNLKRHYAAHRGLFTDVLDVGAPNGILEDICIGNLNGEPVAYASVYGAPMASEVVHVFGVLGTRLVIQTGCCGGIADGLLAGDIFIATSAYSGEGAAQYYKTAGETTAASIAFDEAAGKAKSVGVSLWKGTIFTTSALFAEGAAEIERWRARGFSAVDMETSATFAVAESFGMDRGSILFVFDNPRRGDHVMLESEEKDRRRRIGERVMIEAAFAAIQRGQGGWLINADIVVADSPRVEQRIQSIRVSAVAVRLRATARRSRPVKKVKRAQHLHQVSSSVATREPTLVLCYALILGQWISPEMLAQGIFGKIHYDHP